MKSFSTNIFRQTKTSYKVYFYSREPAHPDEAALLQESFRTARFRNPRITTQVEGSINHQHTKK
jgi:hypothetical protein